jgi:hypothetical protein
LETNLHEIVAWVRPFLGALSAQGRWRQAATAKV